jgi:arginase
MHGDERETHMTRQIALLGATSSIGIRPYDDGTIRELHLAPGALREQGLTARLGASDLGDVIPPPYEDVIRPPGRPRNERGVADYSRELAARVAAAGREGAFVLVLGGDCSIVLGCLLGARRGDHSRIGLVYLDAHADFATPESSQTGSAASMCLALAIGRGDTPLARLNRQVPLANQEDVVVIGRRESGDGPVYGEEVLRTLPLLDLPRAAVRERGPSGIARAAIEHLTRPGIDGFWIHVDADVLDPSVLPAVDSPEPDGLGLDELSDLLRPLVHHPRALGMELTIYDPKLDPARTSAARLAALLERTFATEAQS